MVGKHIRYLEQRLQVTLLNRTTRRQGLTEAGRLFYERCRRLPDYRLLLAASPAYLAAHGTPVSPVELTGHCCIGFSQWDSNHNWTLSGPDGEISVPVNSRLRLDSGEGARRAALADFGILMHAELLLKEDIAAGRLVSVLADYAPLPRPMNLLYLPERWQSPKLEAFIALTMARLWGRT
ncbi:hypothetical protein FCN80_16910 [Martelella alba]|uniref:HTH lysR-type domain-containing protein n=2 Tax=Martelella alba TaxID=2590451 RepID=A0ABY2SIV2_9HYPH|nr:hypothetical protein FCN80_16910 [Martelella alba]